MELQIGDTIEEYNATGLSDRATLKTYVVESVTKTLAKSRHHRFKRETENINGIEHVTKLDTAKWSVTGHRMKQRQ